MKPTRYDFLKFVVTGSVAAGCPFDLSFLAATDDSTPRVDGEHFDICHKVCDVSFTFLEGANIHGPRFS